MQANQHDIRVMVRGAYDLQKLRIQIGNRIVGNFKAKLGQAPGESEDESLDAEGKKIMISEPWRPRQPVQQSEQRRLRQPRERSEPRKERHP